MAQPFDYRIPVPDLGPALSQFAGIIDQNREQRLTRALGDLISKGDIQGAAAIALKEGKLDVGLKLTELATDREASTAFINKFRQGQGGAAPAAAGTPVAPTGTASSNPYAGAIASIESGGRYDALGPVTRTGDRAYGKYQVMGANIPSWTKAALGREMTPEEFRRSPEAQEAVFQHKFVGEYVPKYGPTGAAKAWFAGEGGMNSPNRRDMLGTTVQAYGDKFTQALGLRPDQAVTVAMATPGEVAPASDAPPVVAAAPAAPTTAAAGSQDPFSNFSTAELVAAAGSKHRYKDVAMAALKSRLEASSLTPEMKNYAFYQVQELQAGRKPKSFVDFKKELKGQGPIKIENPTETLLVDPNTRVVLQRFPKDLAGAEAAKAQGQEQGKAQGKAVADLPSAQATAQQSLDLIKKIREHPGRKWGTGAFGVVPGIPGTVQRDFVALVDQAKGKAFLEAYESLKGTGQITQIEGQKATEAIARLDRAQSQQGFLEALKDLEDIIKTGMTRAATRAGAGPALSSPPATRAAPTGTTRSGVKWSIE